ncbi:Ctr copper transporter [Usnea florida]
MDMSPPPLSSTTSSPSVSTTTTMPMMMSTFFSSKDTVLFSNRLRPSNTGQYAGICIFLIVLAAFLRCLLSYRAMLEHGWRRTELQRQQVAVTGERQDGDGGRLRENDIGAGTRRNSSPLGKSSPRRYSVPWRLSTDIPRAFLDMVIALVGYLLMIAVMTMNVGYLCSILGGIFLGSLMFGRFAVNFVP